MDVIVVRTDFKFFFLNKQFYFWHWFFLSFWGIFETIPFEAIRGQTQFVFQEILDFWTDLVPVVPRCSDTKKRGTTSLQLSGAGDRLDEITVRFCSETLQ